MNEDKLLRAVGELDDKLIEEAAPKKKNKSKKWVKWMSVAASVCVIIIVGAIVINQNEGMDKDGEHVGQTEPGIYEPTTKHDILYEGYPEIGLEDTPDVEPKVYEYYIFDGEGKYKLIEESSNRNLSEKEMVSRYFSLNNVDSITVKDVKCEQQEGYDEVQGDVVVHYVDTLTYYIYLEGEFLTDELAIGLVNSALSHMKATVIPGYIKLYLNDEPFLINGEMPEKGYTHIEVSTEGEETDTFSYYIYSGEKRYRTEKREVNPNVKVETVINNYLKLNDVTGTTLVKVKSELKINDISEIETEKGEIIHSGASRDTYEIYLEGEELSEEIAIGLINTVLAYSFYTEHLEYVKLYINNEEYIIGEEMPQKGYQYIDVELENDDKEPWAVDGEYMVDISITVKDESGNPMENITFSLEYVSGEEGSYQPGYGITDSTGEFTRSVHPNATYILHLEKRNAVSYANEIKPVVYEEMLVNLDVKEAFSKEIVWEEDKVTKINDRGEPITIDISDIYDGNREEIFLQLFTEEGGQIQLGYPDKDGKFIWYNGVEGNYSLTLQKFELINGESNIKYAKTYIVELKDGEMNIIKEQDGEIEILE